MYTETVCDSDCSMNMMKMTDCSLEDPFSSFKTVTTLCSNLLVSESVKISACKEKYIE